VSDSANVEAQVNNYQKRVYELYAVIQEWLDGSGYTLDTASAIKFKLYEFPMSRFGIPCVNMDIAAIYKGKKYIGKIAPFGIWVIGTNGALEIALNKTYRIIDKSEPFTQPIWLIEDSHCAAQPVPFTSAWLLNALQNQD
jgi:hypothetical protein